VAEPDGASLDLLLNAPARHYYATATPTKYKLHIVVNGSNPLWPDHVPSYNNYCVGQYLTFTPTWTPSLPSGTQKSPIQWAFGGTFVNDSWTPDPLDYNGSVNYTNNPVLLNNETTSAWWVSGGLNPSATYTATVGEGLTFLNGQYLAVAANGQFKMFRPQITGHTNVRSGSVTLNTNNYPTILLGMSENMTNNIYWQTYVGLDTNFPATLFYVQLVDWENIYDVPYLWPINSLNKYDGTSGQYQLDNEDPTNDAYQVNSAVNFSYSTNVWVPFNDDPHTLGQFYSYVQLTPSFKTYLCFQPSTANSIPITLERAEWSEHGRADLISGVWTLTTSYIIGPNFYSDDSFPFWTQVFLNN
jgi:hypothetical protein